MGSYDAFAPYFDAWQGAFGGTYDQLIVDRVSAALGSHAPGAQSVADLGVGTGDLAIMLAEAGYRVIGVDRSAPMLAVARAKAAKRPSVTRPVFVEQDLRTLALEAPVDAAVCVYTVMNQLVDDGDLLRALAAVHQAVIPRGVFVFEVNLPACYERYWSGRETVQAGDATVTREHFTVMGTPVIEAQVTIRRGGHVVHDTITQRPYSPREVQAALAVTGWVRLARDEFNPFDPTGEPMKALWVVRRA